MPPPPQPFYAYTNGPSYASLYPNEGDNIYLLPVVAGSPVYDQSITGEKNTHVGNEMHWDESSYPTRSSLQSPVPPTDAVSTDVETMVVPQPNPKPTTKQASTLSEVWNRVFPAKVTQPNASKLDMRSVSLNIHGSSIAVSEITDI